MASGSQFYDAHKDLFEFETYSTIHEHSKTGAIIQQADALSTSPYSPTRKRNIFEPSDESQTIKVDMNRRRINEADEGDEGVFNKQHADTQHRRYIKRLEEANKVARFESLDNLLTKGVNAAHSNNGNVVYGSPKRNVAKMLGVTPVQSNQVNDARNTQKDSSLQVAKAPLPRINVPNVTDIDFGEMKSKKNKNSNNNNSNNSNNNMRQDDEFVNIQQQQPQHHVYNNNNMKNKNQQRTPQKPIQPPPPHRRLKEKNRSSYQEYSSPSMQRRVIVPKDDVKKLLIAEEKVFHQRNDEFYGTGKRQVKPLKLSPRLQSVSILPLNAEPLVHRNGKKLLQPALTSRNEVSHHLWADIRNNPSAKPTTGMFNPDLPSRKMFNLPSTEKERLDLLEKTRFLLNYCGGKSFTGYESDMPPPVVNRLKAYQNLKQRKEMLRNLYKKDVEKQKAIVESRLRDWY